LKAFTQKVHFFVRGTSSEWLGPVSIWRFSD